MEIIFYIVILVFIFIIYFALTKFIYKQFTSAKGLGKVLWLFVFILTLSFLFGKDSATDNNFNYGGGGEEDDEHEMFNFFTDDDSYSCNDYNVFDDDCD